MKLKKISRPKWIPRWLSLPFIIFIAFIVMLLFYGENNYMLINQQKKEIDKMNAQIKVMEDSAKFYERKTQELNTDKETLEKIAREQYGMKRTNEEVFDFSSPPYTSNETQHQPAIHQPAAVRGYACHAHSRNIAHLWHQVGMAAIRLCGSCSADPSGTTTHPQPRQEP